MQPSNGPATPIYSPLWGELAHDPEDDDNPRRSEDIPCLQDQSGYSGIPLSDESVAFPEGEEKLTKKGDDDGLGGWQPMWLRPIVLSSFTAFFLALSILLFVLTWISNKNNGLFQTRNDFGYVWRFGPPARMHTASYPKFKKASANLGFVLIVLTVVSALWARVELQTLRYLPWTAGQRGQPFDPKLDYMDMSTPAILVQSLKRKHATVLLVSVVSLVLKAGIVLSPGLFSPLLVGTESPAEVRVLDTFNSTRQWWRLRGWLSDGAKLKPWLNPQDAARAVRDFGMAYPFGVNNQVAYQTFVTSDTKSRGTPQAPVTAVVDGVLFNIECLLLQNLSVGNTTLVKPKYGTEYFETNVTLNFEGCETVWLPIPMNPPEGGNRVWVINDTLWPNDPPCSSWPTRGSEFVYFKADWAPWTANSSIPPKIETAAAVLCSSYASVSKFQVTDTGISPDVQPLAGSPVVLDETDAWKLLSYSVPREYHQWWDKESSNNTVMGPLEVEADFNNQSTGSITSELLRSSVISMSERVGSLVAHYYLRQESESITEARVSFSISKRVVNNSVCLTVAGLFVVVTLMAGYTTHRHGRQASLWHRNPATLLGLLLYLDSYPDLQRQPPNPKVRGMESWHHGSFCPLTARTWAQAVFAIFVSALIACLTITLRLSQSNDGLFPGPTTEFGNFAFTSVPTIVLLSVVLFTNSSDVARRGLSILSGLSIAHQSSEGVDLSILDLLGIHALWRSYQQKHWAASASSMLVLVCGLLTTFTAILFTVEMRPETTIMELPQNSWFGNIPLGEDGNTPTKLSQNRHLGSRIFPEMAQVNYTYMKNTFGNLALPIIDDRPLYGVLQLKSKSNRALKVNATLPAVRLESSCKRLPDDAISLQITAATKSVYFEVAVQLQIPCPNGTFSRLNYSIDFLGNLGNHGFHFGTSLPNAQSSRANEHCGLDINKTNRVFWPVLPYTYLWGVWNTRSETLEFMRLWSCNHSWVQVDTKVNFLWLNGELVIDKDNLPQPDNSSIRLLRPQLVVPHVVSDFVWGYYLGESHGIKNQSWTGSGTEYFNWMLGSLKQPGGKFSVEDFGDPSQEGEILEALNYNLAFMSAQLVNLENRLTLKQNSSSSLFPSDTLPPIKALVTDSSRIRVVQNLGPTYAILAILNIVLIINLAILFAKAVRKLVIRSSFLQDENGIAPKGYNSPSMMALLLRESNAMKYVPPDWKELSFNEFHERMAGIRFRMGWFLRESDETRHYTVGVLGDEEFTFLGSKSEMESMVRSR